MTESNPDRFFENIPETEEATFMFDDSQFSINVLISVRKMTMGLTINISHSS